MQRGRRLIVLLAVFVAPVVALTIVLTSCASRSARLVEASSQRPSVERSVEAEADLAVSMTLEAGDAIVAGDLITSVLKIANAGPDSAEQVVLTQTISSALTYQSVYGEGWACEELGQANICELPGLTAGEASTVTAILESPEEPMTVWTAARVSSDTSDPDDCNNARRIFLRLAEPGADLWLSKWDSADPVMAGEVFSYVVTVHNAGPDDAEAPVVTDTLPTEMDLRDVEVSQGTCSDTICSLGSLPAFGRALITLTVVAPASEGVYTNTARVRSERLDQYLGNNEAHEPVRVQMPSIYLPAIWRWFPSVTGESD